MQPDIAIIGMACVVPGAPDVRTFWKNILGKVSAIADAPPSWEAGLYYDPDAKANDRIYCKRGGFLGDLAQFDPFEFGILPKSIDGAELDHFMALRCASEALQDAGYPDLGGSSERSCVIIGRGTYINRGNAAALQQGVMADAMIRILKQLHPEHTDEELGRIKEKLKASMPGFDSDTSSGLVPNIICGRIANRLDMMGTSFLVDAACASSLVAVEMAARELREGRADIAVAGGVHADTSPVLMMIFSGLKALSARGELRAFDRDADGTLLGEGVGMLVMKRLDQAERDGDRIYSVLKGVGIASDGRALSVFAPRLEGEALAVTRAYREAGVDPATVGLLEAHGTGTPVGDVVEIESLKKNFADRTTESPRCALGSVKSMISHLMPASGAASLIKASLALHHKVLPPTINCENPNPKLGLDKTNFYINTETRPWIHGSPDAPRRAGVNAFGFGGINAHAVLEEYTGPNQPSRLIENWDSELFVYSAPTREALGEKVRAAMEGAESDLARHGSLARFGRAVNLGSPLEDVRLCVVASSVEDLRGKLERALEKISDPKTRGLRGTDGPYFFSEPLGRDFKLAFAFPGEGSQYPNMLGDLCVHFPQVRQMFDLMDRAYHSQGRTYLPSDVIFPAPLGSPSADRLWNMDSGAETVFCANQAMLALLESFELKPDAMVGHSTGEHSALLGSGTVRAEDEAGLVHHILGVYEVFDRLNKEGNIPEAVLLAIAGVDHKLLEQRVAESNGELYIALDNCPHQVVICGNEAAADRLMQSLAGIPSICQKLPFGRAYHTPWFEVFSEPLREHFNRLRVEPPTIPIYSCVTASLYPQDTSEIRRLASVQWASTVRFRETVARMYQDGVRLFVEVGPKNNLTGFIDDQLRGQPHAAIPSNVHHRSGIAQLNHLLGQLIAHGREVRLEALYEHRIVDAPAKEIGKPKPRRAPRTLNTGLQPMRLPEDFQLPRSAASNGTNVTNGQAAPPPAPPPAVAVPAPSSPRQAMLERHMQTMQDFLTAQQGVMSAYLSSRRSGTAPRAAAGVPSTGAAAAPAAGAAIAEALEIPTLGYSNGTMLPAPVLAPVTLPQAVFSQTAPQPPAAPHPDPLQPWAPFPFIDEIVEMVPGERVVARHTFRHSEEPMFQHHTLGLNVSVNDPELRGVPMVPLTGTMEILAECGSLLAPGKVLAGMRDIRATRWVSLEKPEYTMELTGLQKAPGEIHVTLREAGDARSVRPIFAEAICLYADAHPQPGPPNPFVLENEHPSVWKPEELYATGMFHDTLMRGSLSVERAGRNGTSATIGCLPRHELLTRHPNPRFLTDPVVLDAAGQIVAYWFWEAIERGTDLFPYRVAAFHNYRPHPTVGDKLECRVVRRLETPAVIHSDIEVLDRAGNVYYRLEGWETRRFPQPPGFLALRVNPKDSFVSESWEAPRLAAGGDAACRRIADLTPEFLDSSHGVWLKALAHLCLSRQERAVWDGMATATVKRRREWLLGRCAAKDAVRQLLRERFQLALCPADIEITTDPHGRPMAEGVWRKSAGPVEISIAHSSGIAGALACWGPQRPGLDFEKLGERAEGYERLAFTEAERALVGQLPEKDRAEWHLRLWCAKEAAGKAAGTGLSEGLYSIETIALDAGSGSVQTSFPGPAKVPGEVRTGCEGDLVFAVAKIGANT